MGGVTKRRNYCQFSKEIMQGIIDIIMIFKKTGAVEFVEKKLKELVEEKVDIKMLRMTMTLRATYKSEKSEPVHKHVADRMRSRGETVNSNDRIPYVFVMHPPQYNTRGTPIKKNQKEIADNYDYIKTQGLSYDPEIYINSQIKEPIIKVMKYITDNPEAIISNAIQAIREKKYAKYGPPVKALTKAQQAKLDRLKNTE